MDNKFYINIGRQLGSGGKVIGEKLAEAFGIKCYDKELIQLASKESGLGQEFFEKADEKESFSILGGLFGLRTSHYIDESSGANYLCNETLFKIQSDIIRELADNNSCIFVGRCADYILRDEPRCINIFVSANLEDRIKRISEKQNIGTKEAATLIERTDKRRAGYYNYYSNKAWGVSTSYHLCVNTSLLGIDETINFIQMFINSAFK
jgi:cytidylate kinase